MTNSSVTDYLFGIAMAFFYWNSERDDLVNLSQQISRWRMLTEGKLNFAFTDLFFVIVKLTTEGLLEPLA
jgi:hypothetical protein